MSRKAETGLTRYSTTVQGNSRNHGLPMQADLTDGYLGITQSQAMGCDRVLLTPTQVKALLAFLATRRAR